MKLELFYKVGQASTILAIVVALMACIRFKKMAIESRLVGLTSIITLVTYLVLISFTFRGKEVNLPQNVASILIFVTLAITYNFVLKDRYRMFILISACGCLVFAIYNFFFWQGDDNNTYTYAVGSFILIIYCILYLYRLLVDLPVQQLHTVPMFWFNAAILIYRAGTLFLFLFTPYLVKVLNNDLLIYWTFHNILNVVHQIVFIFGLWQDHRNIKSRSLLPSVR